MRSFQQFVVLLFALFAFAFAQESIEYDATVYVTSTVYRVNTVTMPGTPTGAVYNSTSTISASIPSGTPYAPSYSGNGTTIAPTGAYPSTTNTPPANFEGAASHMGVNGLMAILAAGVAFLAL